MSLHHSFQFTNLLRQLEETGLMRPFLYLLAQNHIIFIRQLNKVDTDFRGNLSSSNCPKRDFIPFHLAFAYFAPHYDLTQHPIHEGLTPSGEVRPQKLVEVVNLARNLGLKLIYNEDLI